ncbi:MAG: C39 family peptidase [Vicinamibacterales bacterium]
MPTLIFAALVSVASAQSIALPRAVPYLPQTEALCGGAAAAMVMRYWGDPLARAEDFAPLIDQAQGGIVTTALVADLRRRKWQAFPLRGRAGDAAPVAQHLSRGRPIVALIEDRPSRYHYVVITALDRDRVHFHDPAAAPSQAMPRTEFDRRWATANFWMLLLLPASEPVEPVEPGTRTEPGEPKEPVEPMEPVLATRVATLLHSGDRAEALRLATDATTADPANAVAWDALGTTLFVMDRDVEALEAWNRAGKPDVDTVQIAGLERTRYRAAERLIDLRPGDRLSAARLGRARRRLALLPSSSASRVSYTPLADGRVQLDAAIVERSRRPGAVDLVMTAAEAPFTREVDVAFTNPVGGGERVTGSWRFREGFERITAAVETPAPLPFGAVWKLSGFDARETYEVGDALTIPRWRRGGFQAVDWITPSLGWAAGAAFDRWPFAAGGARDDKVYGAARILFAVSNTVYGHLTAERWTRRAGLSRFSGRARAGFQAIGGRLTIAAGAERVGDAAPLFLLPGAGDGHTRRPLLRAHPLIRDGAIGAGDGRIIGQRLIHGTVEWSRPVLRMPLASIDAALFTDAARAWRLIDGRASDGQIDAGAGVRIRLLGGGPSFRIDLARGLLDRRWALTAGTVVGLEHWIF